MRGALLAFLLGSYASPVLAQVMSEPPSSLAVVVLIGEASESAPLRDVISELLVRQGVQAQVESRPRFEPDAWLDASAADARAWAFVSVQGPQRAELYFRGPHGERFLLRELALRNGLDEVGRELIARVVETSTVALLHSSEGVSREEARAGLSRASESEGAKPSQQNAPVVAVPTARTKPERAHAPAKRELLLGVRALGHWSGADLGALIAAGLEAAVALNHAQWPRLRARISLEAALPQRLETTQVSARVITLPMRLGLDLGSARGTHRMYLGLSTGFDIVHVAPEALSAPGLVLLASSTELVPSSRAELRYELSLSRDLGLALSALADLPWTATRYDVIQNGTHKHLATPWRIQPGIALTLFATP